MTVFIIFLIIVYIPLGIIFELAYPGRKDFVEDDVEDGAEDADGKRIATR